MVTRKPVIIIVGAGRGSRFQGAGHKLAQTLGDRSILERTIGHALETGLAVKAVVTQPLTALVGQLLARKDLVLMPDAVPGSDLGMGHSIARGVLASGEATGWLILPADMPAVRPETLMRVAAALRDHPIAHAQHLGRRGHPVAFGAEFYSELIALRGDEGARRILSRYPVQPIEVDDAGVLMDVDTEADLKALRERMTLA